MAITYTVSTNLITVTAYTSGTPCTFTDVYNADKAGTLSLHARTGITAADGSAVAVDRAERPADYVVLGGGSNDLYITVANWNGTTATIRITGTDHSGVAQTEDIVVTANGTNYTTKWFKTITHTQVTSATVTTFDYTLTQGQWGVVSIGGTNQFGFECGLYIGDGSTATWFVDTRKQIKIGTSTTGQLFKVATSANFTLGSYSSNTPTDGCHLDYISPTAFVTYYDSTGTINLYATTVHFTGHYANFRNKAVNNWKSSILTQYSTNFFFYDPASGSITRQDFKSTSNASYTLYIYTSGITFTDVLVMNMLYGVTVGWSQIGTFTDSTFLDNTYDVRIYQNSFLNLLNCSWDESPYFQSSTSGWVRDKKTFDLKIVDNTDTPINSARVKIWDVNDTLLTNTTTDANGVITQQTIEIKYYTPTASYSRNPHELRSYKYGKSMLSSKTSIEAETDWALTMLADPHITQTTEATVAAYSGISVNHTTETITITADHTLDEIYDYCQYDIIASTKQLDQTMHTSDGVNFTSEYSFTVNTGKTVTATDQKLSVVAGETYTLSGTAQFIGIIATTTTTRIPVKLTNVVDGSRYWVGKESDGTTIFEGTQSGSGTVTGYYEHTANIDIDIRVRKSSAAVKYKPWVGEGTLSAEVFSLRIRQILDSIIS